MPAQDLEKVSIKKYKYDWIFFYNKIRGLVNWCQEQDIELAAPLHSGQIA